MGIAAVKIKVLPTSPEIDLERLKEALTKMVEDKGGKNCTIEAEPIAFGLEALIVFFAWPEEKELENLEESMGKLEEVSSIQVIDMRRALG